eukprot:1451688-Amphidinium_carterae.2
MWALTKIGAVATCATSCRDSIYVHLMGTEGGCRSGTFFIQLSRSSQPAQAAYDALKASAAKALFKPPALCKFIACCLNLAIVHNMMEHQADEGTPKARRTISVDHSRCGHLLRVIVALHFRATLTR